MALWQAAISGAWTTDDVYTLQVVESGTPFQTTYRMKFGAAELVLEAERNLGPANAKPAPMVGKIE